MSDQKQFKMPWTLFAHNKLTLYGDAWKENKKKPSLKFKVWENNPRFNLYMNDDKTTKAIAFALDTFILQDIFEIIKLVVSKKDTSRYTIELKADRDHKNNIYDKPTAVSKIFIGRDSEGMVYLAFGAKGEAIAKFPFVTSYWAEITNAAGEKLEKDILSEIRAMSWANVMHGLMINYTVMHAKEKVINNDNKKTGSWNKKSSSSDSSTSSDFSADEDVEF